MTKTTIKKDNKERVLVTLTKAIGNEDYQPFDVLEFVKRSRAVETSAALSMILMEWYEWRSTDGVVKRGTPFTPKENIPEVNYDEPEEDR